LQQPLHLQQTPPADLTTPPAETSSSAATTPSAATAPYEATTPAAANIPFAANTPSAANNLSAATTHSESTTLSTSTTPTILRDTVTEPKQFEEENNSEGDPINVLTEIIDNIINDRKPSVPIIIEERKNISLKITVDSDTTAEFKGKGAPLGLVCDAASEVDNDIKFQWTKNGRFIDTTSSHVTLETMTNGK
jgi:hypothetical protein